MKKIIIIDGNSLAFGKNPIEHNNNKFQKSSIDERDIFIVRKFIKKMLKFKYVVFKGYELVVLFDEADKVTFRHEMYPRYKNKKSSESRIKQKKYVYNQIEEIKKLLLKMNIPYYSHKNWEADDIIGMLINKLEKRNFLTTIISGDKDILQLVSDKTRVAFLTNKNKFKITNRNNVWDITNGVWPDQIIDTKILSGDKSDNIKGIGILRKDKSIDYWTNDEAIMFIKKYGSIKRMIENIDKIENPYKNSLLKANDKIKLNKKLITIIKDWSIEIDFSYFIGKKINKTGLDYVIKDLNLEKLLENKKFKENLEKEFE